MAGIKHGYVAEMQGKMAYFRNELDFVVTQRPTQNNHNFIEYITNRWQMNDNTQRSAHVDIIFMAVSLMSSLLYYTGTNQDGMISIGTLGT